MAQAETSGSLATAVADVRCESEDEAMPSDVKKNSFFFFIYLRQWLKRKQKRVNKKKEKTVLAFFVPSGKAIDCMGMRAQESSVVFGKKGPLMRQMGAYTGTGSGQYATATVRTD